MATTLQELNILFGCLMLILAAGSKSQDLAQQSDPSGLVSVAFREGKWKVIPALIDWEKDASIIARANFTNAQSYSGWMILEVQTRQDAPDQLQAEAAGIAEGFLTRTSIVENYKQSYLGTCKEDPELCKWAKEMLNNNTAILGGKIAKKFQNDSFWHHLNLIYLQMDGMSKGCQLRNLTDPKYEDDEGDERMDYENGILLLNIFADFYDLIDYYNLGDSVGAENVKKTPRPSCSVMIKYLKEKRDIYLGHNTWHGYEFMAFRILKKYNFNFHITPNSNDLVPGHTITMSSYSGVIASIDDFYLISSGLAATETTNIMYNKELFRNMTFEYVFEPFRVMIANRLSQFGSQWAELFSRENSGTYNNQWMIVNYNLLAEDGENLKAGVLTVLEQLPDFIVVEDQTQYLRDRGYWKSYNRAFYPEVFELSGAAQMAQEYGQWFSYENAARSKISDRDHGKITNMTTFLSFMRYNDYENDPAATIESCEPSRKNPAGAIAGRLDLTDPSLKCNFSLDANVMLGFGAYGALDAKLASKDSFPTLDFIADAGPTHDTLPPFSWQSTTLDKPSFIPIVTFKFDPYETRWGINSGAGISEWSYFSWIALMELFFLSL